MGTRITVESNGQLTVAEVLGQFVTVTSAPSARLNVTIFQGKLNRRGRVVQEPVEDFMLSVSGHRVELDSGLYVLRVDAKVENHFFIYADEHGNVYDLESQETWEAVVSLQARGNRDWQEGMNKLQGAAPKTARAKKPRPAPKSRFDRIHTGILDEDVVENETAELDAVLASAVPKPESPKKPKTLSDELSSVVDEYLKGL